MKTIQIKLYPFPELSDEAKEQALNDLRYSLVDGVWWEGIYEDARQAGLTITGFELENGYYCNAEFIEDAISCASKILGNHGQSTATYKTTHSFWTERNKLIANWPKEENGALAFLWDLDCVIDSIEEDFLTAIRWAYHSMLIQEYNLWTGDEALIESFEANDYPFTADGKLATRLEKLAEAQIQN